MIGTVSGATASGQVGFYQMEDPHGVPMFLDTASGEK